MIHIIYGSSLSNGGVDALLLYVRLFCSEGRLLEQTSPRETRLAARNPTITPVLSSLSSVKAGRSKTYVLHTNQPRGGQPTSRRLQPPAAAARQASDPPRLI